MKYLTLPKALYNYPGISKFFYNEESCILFKKLNKSLLNQEKVAVSHCFVFVVKGIVEVKNSQGEFVSAQPGNILFMPRDTYLISDFVKDDNSLELYLIFIGHEIVDSFLGLKKDRGNDDFVSTICAFKAPRSVSVYFDSIKNIYHDLDNNQEILTIKILEFLHLVYVNNREDIVSTLCASERYNKKRDIASFMLNNFEKNMTIEDFANLSGRSLSSFNRDFKKKYGETPKRWLTEKKMEKANKLLLANYSVTDCALEVGYSNVSHFIKAYKLIYGKTPREAKNFHF